MDIVVTGRRTAVDESLRSYLSERLDRVAKLDPKVNRVDVEVCEEANHQHADERVRVELTWRSRGPIVRGEAAAAEPHAAADLALAKLDRRLRRAADRRRVHHGSRTPVSVAAATAAIAAADGAAADAAESAADEQLQDAPDSGPMVVREKEHRAGPMTLDQALFEMELVGHEFYLFIDADSGLPSVVYLRRGYDYGVLRLVSEDG